MNVELLLHWLSSAGTGRWPAFRQAIARLADEDADREMAARIARARLSDLGHVDFFVGGTSLWRVLRPVIGGLAETPGKAVLCGARSNGLLETLQRAASQAGCGMEVIEVPDSPLDVRLSGPAGRLSALGEAVGVSYIPDLATELCTAARPIAEVVESSPQESFPHNWAGRSFDLSTLSWVEGITSAYAYQFVSRHGPVRYYVRGEGRVLRRVDRRVAIYAAAARHRRPLADYDDERQILSTPILAPLPDAYARIAALCTGRAAQRLDGRLMYEGVPNRVASLLLALVGQRPFDPVWASIPRKGPH